MSIYDWACANLIHDYVELHHSDWWKENCSELEYIDRHFLEFREWADALGYVVTKEW